VSHRSLLGAAGDARTAHDVDDGTRVVLRTSLATVDAVASGVVAPLSCGGAVVLADEAAVDDRARGDMAVVTDADRQIPEKRRITASDIPRP